MTSTWPKFSISDALVVNGHQTALSQLVIGPAEDPPTVVFVHSALLDRHAWYPAISELANRLPTAARLVAYDLRGHGTAAGEPISSIEQLADDLIEVCASCSNGPVHVVGLSLGGAVVQAAALASPRTFASVTVLGTSARFIRSAMNDRAERGRHGVAALVDDTIARWVSEPRDDNPVNTYVRASLARTSPTQWVETWQALGQFDVADQLSELRQPLLAIAGHRDVASPPAELELIANSVASGTVEYVDAAHLSALEEPSLVGRHIIAHLTRHWDAVERPHDTRGGSHR